MDEHGVRRDERCWTTVHKSLARLGDYSGSVETLGDSR